MSDKILVIDEEDWYMEPILERLTNEGIDHKFCQTVAEGLEAFHEMDFVLAIIDMRMPFGTNLGISPKDILAPGLFLVDQIRKQTDIPIICYTASNNQDVIDAIQQRKSIHIPKADDPDNLIKKIKSLLSL